MAEEEASLDLNDDPGLDDLELTFDAEEIDGNLGDLDDKDEKPDEKDTKDSDDSEEPKSVSVEDYESLKNNYESLQKHKTDLDKAIHGLRQEVKSLKTSEKDDDVELTDAQWMGLAEAHKDDPATLMQLIDYRAKVAAKTAGKETETNLELTNMKKDADKFLGNMYPDIFDESSQIRGMVNQTKEYYGLDDNPLGDLYSAGVLALNHLPTLLKEAKEAGKNEALGKNAEDKRKKNIDNLKPAEKGRRKESKSTSLSGQAADTAKQMGLTPAQEKLYAKMLKNKKSASVEV